MKKISNNIEKQLTMVVLGVLLAGAAIAAVDMTKWSWKMPVTFDGYPAERTELTNFPALLVLEDGVNGMKFADFKAGGSDLRFTDEAGSVLLNHEIESWDAENGKAWIWLQVPQLTNGVVVLAHWGNPDAELPECATNGSAWSEGFKAVWHMTADDNDKLAESTANKYTGTLTAVVSVLGDGLSAVPQIY